MYNDFLEVSKSLSNRAWIGPSYQEERRAYSLLQDNNISQIVALMLAKRGIESDEVGSYMSPKIKDLMPDPYTLKDMQKASERLLKSVVNREQICIFGDYDVDGTTSASMLLLWLKHFKITPEIYIPDRVIEGYGPNIEAMETLSKKNKLIICVDCGSVAHDEIELANLNGADVLVLDHHIVNEVLPPALAIINPKRKDESGELNYLCAAGVVFLFLVSLNRLLRIQGMSGPNIMSFLDLVALATVADVVPLVKLNRALVSQGLKVLAHRDRPGLVALIDEAQIKTLPTAYHLGYLIAPRINAAGRLSDAKFAVDLLTTVSSIDSIKIAQKLDELNNQRKELENETFYEALAQIEIQNKDDENIIWVFSDRWHPGVIGIVAARLKEKFNVPSLVFSVNEKNLAVGSVRSVKGVDIGKEIKTLVDDNLIISGGGHHMAAGIKSHQNQLTKAMAELSKNIKKNTRNTQLKSALNIDSLISIRGATIELVEEISSVGPFGAGNPAPIIAIANCQVKFIKVLTNKHIKFICLDPTGKRLESIFFNGVETTAGQQLLKNAGESYHFCGKIEINDWGGYRRVVFTVEDVALV